MITFKCHSIIQATKRSRVEIATRRRRRHNVSHNLLKRKRTIETSPEKYVNKLSVLFYLTQRRSAVNAMGN